VAAKTDSPQWTKTRKGQTPHVAKELIGKKFCWDIVAQAVTCYFIQICCNNNSTRNFLDERYRALDCINSLSFLLDGGSGATRPLPRDRSVEELHEDPTVGPRPQGLDQRSKMEMARRRGSDAGQSRRR